MRLDARAAAVITSQPAEKRARMVRLAPWSAAVYVRDFDDGSTT